MKVLLLLVGLTCFNHYQAENIIKVHFLYGSTPKKEFPTETKWFGGKWGGHVGIEYSPNKIVSLVPSGDFHYIKHKKKRASKFVLDNEDQFYTTFGGNPEDMKKLIISIPITDEDQKLLDSIVTLYVDSVPYDYAFIGMWCAAAAYDLISYISPFKHYSYVKTSYKNFYPKKLRKRLLKIAKKQHYLIERYPGSLRRDWEKD